MINGYKIWDKQSPINGTNAGIILQDVEFRDNAVLFLTEDDKPVRHMFFEIEPSEEECQAILLEIQKEQQVEENERLSLEKAENKISILEEENADLLLDSATKDAKLSALEKDLADLTVEVIKGGM